MEASSSKAGPSRPSGVSQDTSPPPKGRTAATQYHPICTTCAKPSSTIYKSYTPTLVVLVRCSNPTCKRLIDSYGDEEYRPGSGSHRSMSGSWMDLILVKPRAYRHFLYNLPFLLPAPGSVGNAEHSEWREWKTIIKRTIALSLVDGYLRWFYLCAYSSASHGVGREAPRFSLPSLVGGLGNALRKTLRLREETALEVRVLRQMGMTEMMVGSYLMVWVGTLLETMAMYAMVTGLSWSYVVLTRWRRKAKGTKRDKQRDTTPEDAAPYDALDLPGPIDVPPPDVELLDLYRPSLIPNALLLSSLTTLLLLSIVLLWESKLPRPDGAAAHVQSSTLPPLRLNDIFPQWIVTKLTSHVSGTQIEEGLKALGAAFSTDFAVRTLLGGLNAGVSLAVIHPKLPFLTTSLLLLGWLAAYHVRTRFTLLPSDVGPGGATAGGHRWSAEAEAAVGWYCAVCC